MTTHFLNLYCMVLADGIVSPKELETLYRIGRENYSLSEDDINHAIMTSGTTFAIPATPEDRVRTLYEMALIAWADGIIDNSERNLLQTYALRYGIEDAQASDFVDYLLQQAQANVSEDKIIKELTN